MRLASLAWTCVVAAGSVGCGLVSGLSDLEVADDGGMPADVAAIPDVASDAKSDAKPCAKSETDCTDGLDDDCNGKIDCEDQACTGSGFSCQTVPPQGFSRVDLRFAFSSADCPGSSLPKDLVVSVSAPSTCSCSCTGAVTCSALAGVTTYGNQSCTTNPMPYSLQTDGLCHPLSPSFTFDGLRAAGTLPQATATCTTAATLTPPTTTTKRICTPLLPQGGAGCGPGRSCAGQGPVGTGFAACLSSPGDVACPSGWPTKYVGGSLQDDRKCAPCSCTATGTCPTTALFYSGNACLVLAATVALGPCGGNKDNAFVAAYKATTTPTVGSCTAPGVAALGAATITSLTTICCPP